MKELEKLIMALYKRKLQYAKVLTHGERAPGIHWIGDWVGPRSSWDIVEKRNILPLLGIQPLRTDQKENTNSSSLPSNSLRTDPKEYTTAHTYTQTCLEHTHIHTFDYIYIDYSGKTMEDNIKIDSKEIGCEDVNWIQLL
jgi:hypothetical protein